MKNKKIVLICLSFLVLFFIVKHYYRIYPDEVGSIESANPSSLTFNVKKFNSSSLLLRLEIGSYNNSLYMADPFSNAREYIEILSFQNGINNVFNYSNFLFSSKRNSDSNSLDYIAVFPIFWGSPKAPYAYFSDDFGVSESLFLFFKQDDYNFYDIDFSDSGLKVFNSGYGNGTRFLLQRDELFQTYFVFGNYTSCSKNYNDFNVNILFGGGFEKNDSFCDQVYSIFEYYYKEFGRPVRLRANYTIGFFPAKCFMSSASGFFRNSFDLSIIAHELFHLWQPEWYNCSNDLLYREGLASFMQYYSLYKVGIIDQTTLENTFIQKLDELRKIPDLNLLYNLNQSELIKLRKVSPLIYGTLVYGKGALLWNEINKSGVPINDEFNRFLKTKDCLTISTLVSRYENKVYDLAAS